jgi:hypothetical protein
VKAAGVALVAIVLVIGGIFGLRWVLAEPSGAIQQREMTVGNGAYRIQAYEQFFTDCGSAKTVQQNLAAAVTAAQQGRDSGVDANRQAQLDANVTGLTAQLNRAVNDYNAHARETDTRAHFLDSTLPFEISADSPIDCTVGN